MVDFLSTWVMIGKWDVELLGENRAMHLDIAGDCFSVGVMDIKSSARMQCRATSIFLNNNVNAPAVPAAMNNVSGNESSTIAL